MKAQRTAIAALGKIGPDAKPAVPALTDLYYSRDTDEDGLRAVLEALWEIDPPAIAAFVGVSLNPHDPIQDAVDELLRKSDPKAKAVIDVIDEIARRQKSVGSGGRSASALGEIGPKAEIAVTALSDA